MSEGAEDAQTARVLRGKGRYAADLPAPGAAAVVFLRADRAHARLRALDCAAARAAPGAVAVLTADDLGPLGAFPSMLRQPTVDGRPLISPRRPVLIGDRARHAGELVALVAAETEAQALDALERLAPEWEELAPALGFARGAEGRPQIHAEAPGNLAAEVAMGDAAAVAAAMAGAAEIVELTVETPRLAPAPLEPRCVIAAHDPATGVFDLWTPHQGLNEVRRDACAVLGIPAEALRVHAHEVGGAFGARGAAYPEAIALLAAARRLGRPLRWQGTRAEMFLSDHHGRAMRLTGRLALSAEGRFTALEVTAEADLGAYVHPVGAHIAIGNPAMTLTGCYAIPAACARTALRFTNAVPLGPYRGAGRPDIALLVERLVDEAAARTGRDPVALRRLNAIAADAFPYRAPLGGIYDSGDYPGLLDRAQALPAWTGRAARAEAARARGRLAGTGLALFVEVAGGGPGPRDEIRLRLETRGGAAHVVAETASKNAGQGHDAVYRGLIAARLGLPTEAVSLVESPPDAVLAGSGSFASRSTVAVGSALDAGCGALIGALEAEAAARLGLPEGAVRFDGQGLRGPDGPIPGGWEAALLAAAQAGRATTGSAPSVLTYPSGCHVAEVEIDPETGALRVTGYAALDDAGRVLSHPHAQGQVRGGVVQSLGAALAERIETDAEGQLLTASLMDYALPRAADAPWIAVMEHDAPSPTNPLGAKGVGEAGATGALAAIANAVADALRGAGAAPPQMPWTAERLWRALRAAQGAPGGRGA